MSQAQTSFQVFIILLLFYEFQMKIETTGIILFTIFCFIIFLH